jgi:hypothetical protein
MGLFRDHTQIYYQPWCRPNPDPSQRSVLFFDRHSGSAVDVIIIFVFHPFRVSRAMPCFAEIYL